MLREKISSSLLWNLRCCSSSSPARSAALSRPLDRRLRLDLLLGELRVGRREIGLAVAQLLLRLGRIEAHDDVALLDRRAVGREPRDLHRARIAAALRRRDRRRLDRAQVALGGHAAHERSPSSRCASAPLVRLGAAPPRRRTSRRQPSAASTTTTIASRFTARSIRIDARHPIARREPAT